MNGGVAHRIAAKRPRDVALAGVRGYRQPRRGKCDCYRYAGGKTLNTSRWVGIICARPNAYLCIHAMNFYSYLDS